MMGRYDGAPLPPAPAPSGQPVDPLIANATMPPGYYVTPGPTGYDVAADPYGPINPVMPPADYTPFAPPVLPQPAYMMYPWTAPPGYWIGLRFVNDPRVRMIGPGERGYDGTARATAWVEGMPMPPYQDPGVRGMPMPVPNDEGEWWA